jgi:hypothetical protein
LRKCLAAAVLKPHALDGLIMLLAGALLTLPSEEALELRVRDKTLDWVLSLVRVAAVADGARDHVDHLDAGAGGADSAARDLRLARGCGSDSLGGGLECGLQYVHLAVGHLLGLGGGSLSGLNGLGLLN